MANNNVVALRGYFNNDTCMANLRAMLGQKAQGFVTSVLSVVNNNKLLQNAEPATVYSSAMVAASLDLPIQPNLGFAAIVPYGHQAQFQIMTKGLLQLAIRSGQYERVTNAVVHKGERTNMSLTHLSVKVTRLLASWHTSVPLEVMKSIST